MMESIHEWFFNGELFNGELRNNVYWRRSDAIKEQLAKYDIDAKVSRHHLKDWRVYCLDISTEDGHVSEDDIIEALDIPREWLHFIHIDTANKYVLYWVDEEMLHSKYLQDGELVFTDPMVLAKDSVMSLFDSYDCVGIDIINNVGTSDVYLKFKR